MLFLEDTQKKDFRFQVGVCFLQKVKLKATRALVSSGSVGGTDLKHERGLTVGKRLL